MDGAFYCAELHFDALLAIRGADPEYVPLPKFPLRDPRHCCGMRRSGECRRTGSVHPPGRQRASGKNAPCSTSTAAKALTRAKSVAFNLVLRSDERSLTAEEADTDVQHILDTLKEQLGAVLR